MLAGGAAPDGVNGQVRVVIVVTMKLVLLIVVLLLLC
jgi:hypothetical protein